MFSQIRNNLWSVEKFSCWCFLHTRALWAGPKRLPRVCSGSRIDTDRVWGHKLCIMKRFWSSTWQFWNIWFILFIESSPQEETIIMKASQASRRSFKKKSLSPDRNNLIQFYATLPWKCPWRFEVFSKDNAIIIASVSVCLTRSTYNISHNYSSTPLLEFRSRLVS